MVNIIMGVNWVNIVTGCGVPAFLSLFSTTFLKIVLGTATGLNTVTRGRKGMFGVKRIAAKIIMAVNYSGRKLAQIFSWAAPAYHKREGATTHPGERMMAGLMGAFGVQVGMWNPGSQS